MLLLEDTPSPARPDAVFPNNWVSFHRDGTVALYPMCPVTRRAERRRDLVDEIAARGFRVGRVLDFSAEEERGRFLEGTGSMVLDRVHHVAFASLSPRTDAGLLAEIAPRLGYRPHAFRALVDGHVPYHTNVILSVGDGLALWCPDTVVDEDRAALRAALDGRDVIDLAPAQIHAFAGNVLQLAGVVALSRAALASLAPAQVATLERHGAIVAADLDTIERVGGGSARCMLAEVFLPTA